MAADKAVRILVAMDRSQQGQDMAQYLGDLLGKIPAEVILYHVFSKMPDSYYDVTDHPIFRQKVREVTFAEAEEADRVKQALYKASKILTDSGLPTKAVTIQIHDRVEGVARDIIEECKNYYTAVAVGRRGLSPFKDVILGSLATKLVNSLHHLPVWVVGGKPKAQKYLVGIDGSEGCMRAVNHLATIISGRKGIKIKLVYVIRRLTIPMGWNGSSTDLAIVEQSWEKATQETADYSLTEAENALLEAGVDKAYISRQVISEAASRAGSLVEEAKSSGCGTIVVGRRGLSKVEEFFMGRVTNKVLHLAKESAVWVVH